MAETPMGGGRVRLTVVAGGRAAPQPGRLAPNRQPSPRTGFARILDFPPAVMIDILRAAPRFFFPKSILSLEKNLPRVPEARGRALLFWDPQNFGEKLSRIDTDQVIPSVDCVSSDMTDISKPWGEGVFRHLLPSFREELRRGKTFIIVGTHFGIGSSREMAVAGLLRAAKDAGQEGNLVIICAGEMGEIFRKNAINSGMHVIESEQAVRDAEEGHAFEFDPNTRTLRNATLRHVYREGPEIKPFSREEKIVYRSGGIVEVYRKLDFPIARWRRGWFVGKPSRDHWEEMTATERILERHRVLRGEKVEPGRVVHVRHDCAPGSDGTWPLAILAYQQITGNRSAFPPLHPGVFQDHFAPSYSDAYAQQTAITKEFAARWGIQDPFFGKFGDGIFHFLMVHRGIVVPGGLFPGADSHTTTYGAYGSYARGIGSTELGMAVAMGYLPIPVNQVDQVTLRGRIAPWVGGKDLALAFIASLTEGGKWVGARGRSIEFVDPLGKISMPMRHVLCNMAPEFGATTALFPHDEVTDQSARERGVNKYPYGEIVPGANARYHDRLELRLRDIGPMIARPFHPKTAVPANEVADERLPIDQAAIGSCTNGDFPDILMAALVADQLRKRGYTGVSGNLRAGTGKVQFLVIPGSRMVAEQIQQPHPLLGERSPHEVLTEGGAMVTTSSCQHCFLAESQFGLKRGMRAVLDFNRNFERRNGEDGSESFLAGAATVTASAFAGVITTPERLGLKWGPPFTELAA